MRASFGVRAGLLLSAALAAACGSSSPNAAPGTWQALANRCASPRTGTDPSTLQPYPDRQGSLDDEKAFLRAWTDDLYLWYREVPGLVAGNYATATAYFRDLRTTALTASGTPKDKFHFTYDTAVWNQLSQSGSEAGYGMEVVLISRTPPREAVVAYTEPGTPAVAASANLARGAHILKVDGVDLVNGTDTATLNAGLFPANTTTPHTFEILDSGATTSRTVTMTPAIVTHPPVQNAGQLAASPQVGYLLFNDHLASAEKALIDALTPLQGKITELVLDIRYNGGGYLAIASELAYMVAGPAPTAGKIFEKTVFNDKHPTTDPFNNNQPIRPMPFIPTALGFTTVPRGQALPHLDLKRVYVLTGPHTCSASEAVMNGLRGAGVPVIQIGSATCGKPYGFYPQDNCGTTYFSIQFQGVNDQGFGDYSDGFVPGSPLPNGVPGCQVKDDFSAPLGNPSEARLAAALQHIGNGTCPPASSVPAAPIAAASTPEGEMVKPPWRENRLYRTP